MKFYFYDAPQLWNATMGTPKQATALIKIQNLLRAQQGGRMLTPEQEQELRAEVAAATHAQLQRVFKEWNAKLGFDKFTSPATPEQLRRVREMEVQLYGEVRTRQYIEKLSYDAADHLLKTLIAERAERRAGVRTLEQLANGTDDARILAGH